MSLSVALSAALLGVVLAAGDCKTQKQERRLAKFEVQDHKATFDGEAVDCGEKNRINVDVDVSDNSARMRIDYRARTKESKAALSLRAKFTSIVEFKDNNNDNIPQQDEIVQTYPFGPWREMDSEKVEVEADDDTTPAMTFNARTTDGVVGITGYFTNRPITRVVNATTGQSITLTPNAFKFDLNIDQFQYSGTGTKLAVAAGLRTKSKLKENGGGQGTVVTQDRGVNAAFVWDKTISCDGVEVPVVASALESFDDSEAREDGENDRRVWLTFDTTQQCESLFWDPSIETTGAPESNPAAAVVPSVAMLLAAALALRY